MSAQTAAYLNIGIRSAVVKGVSTDASWHQVQQLTPAISEAHASGTHSKNALNNHRGRLCMRCGMMTQMTDIDYAKSAISCLHLQEDTGSTQPTLLTYLKAWQLLTYESLSRATPLEWKSHSCTFPLWYLVVILEQRNALSNSWFATGNGGRVALIGWNSAGVRDRSVLLVRQGSLWHFFFPMAADWRA